MPQTPRWDREANLKNRYQSNKQIIRMEINGQYLRQKVHSGQILGTALSELRWKSINWFQIREDQRPAGIYNDTINEFDLRLVGTSEYSKWAYLEIETKDRIPQIHEEIEVCLVNVIDFFYIF